MDSVFVIKDIFSAAVVSEALERIKAVPFHDGSKTASGMARSVKHNEQLPIEEVPGLTALITANMLEHRLFRQLTMPRAVANIMVSRYQVGMSYGTHTDAAVMPSGHRSDISFTLFLSDPDTYKGGELVLESSFGNHPVRLKAGSMIVYPTGELHRVSPVTEGERIALVGWVESRIRDARKRQIVLDLDKARAAYLEKVGHDRYADLLMKSVTNLRRMWDD
ncbi:MAG: Fe2+-dependent dioxygenase [Porticoccaceae bacterium]